MPRQLYIRRPHRVSDLSINTFLSVLASLFIAAVIYRHLIVLFNPYHNDDIHSFTMGGLCQIILHLQHHDFP